MVKKLTIKESIDLNDYTYKFIKQGYKLYSKMVNNKAQWVAVGKDGIPFEVSYEAVRGFEPINPADAKLQKKVAKALKMESGNPYTSEETGSYTAQDAKEAAKQVFHNAYSLYNKTGTTISEFQIDVELDTNKFWDTLASLCSNNGFEYVIVSEDENFDDKYYTIKLMDVEEVDECIYESITIGDTTYSDEDIEDAVAYAYGLLPQKAHEEVLRGTYSDKEIRKAIIYWELRDLPYRIRQTEFRKRCREANLESLDKQLFVKESTYTDLGYKDREGYLKSLADDYGVDINTVKELAYALGPEEDFDALVSEIEDLVDDSDNGSEKDPIYYYLDNYDYVVCSTDSTYENFDFIFPYDTYKFAKKELARDLLVYKTETCLFDEKKKTKTNYSPNKLDVSKLNAGGHGWVEEDEDYINPENVGETVAQQNIDKILRMCHVNTEQH